MEVHGKRDVRKGKAVQHVPSHKSVLKEKVQERTCHIAARIKCWLVIRQSTLNRKVYSQYGITNNK